MTWFYRAIRQRIYYIPTLGSTVFYKGLRPHFLNKKAATLKHLVRQSVRPSALACAIFPQKNIERKKYVRSIFPTSRQCHLPTAAYKSVTDWCSNKNMRGPIICKNKDKLSICCKLHFFGIYIPLARQYIYFLYIKIK